MRRREASSEALRGCAPRRTLRRARARLTTPTTRGDGHARRTVFHVAVARDAVARGGAWALEPAEAFGWAHWVTGGGRGAARARRRAMRDDGDGGARVARACVGG